MKKIIVLSCLIASSAFAYPVSYFKCDSDVKVSIMHAEYDVNLAWVSAPGANFQLGTGEFEMKYNSEGNYTFNILVNTDLTRDEFTCVEYFQPSPTPNYPHYQY